MDYKFVVIRRVHNVLIRFDTERGRTGPGNHNKKSSRRSSLVACFVRPICVCFYHVYRAYSPQLMNPMKVNLKYMT